MVNIFGAGINGLVLAHIKQMQGEEVTIYSKDVGGQLSAAFLLGPRILQATSDKVYDFVKSIGINDKPTVFPVKYMKNFVITGNLTDEDKISYYRKTRGYNALTDDCLSGMKTEVIGWDMNRYDMVGLLSKGKKIVKRDVLDKEFLEQVFNDEKNKYYSTIPYNALANKVFGIPIKDSKEVREQYFYKVDFESAYYMYLCDFEYHKGSYIYELKDPVIKRFTILDKCVIIETVKKDDGLKGFPKIIIPSQVTKNKCYKNIHNIELVGRYAEMDHRLLVSDVIERFM